MSPRCRRTLPHLACVFLTAIAAAAPIACGSDDDEEKAGTPRKANAAEKAFLTGMVSHHESAIEMADIAQQRAEDPFVKDLAGAITSSQKREVAQMRDIHRRLFGGELKPDPGAHDGLGLSAQQAGMTHSPQTIEMLRSADPFDRAFVDEMVPHHEGAIKMAGVLLRRTKDAPLRKLAEGIISMQEREIGEMNDFRTKKFGGPVPEGARHGMESEGETRDGGNEHGADHPG